MAREKHTDFESYGIAKSDVTVCGRQWVFTIDFEAFDPKDIDLWIEAMDTWAQTSKQVGWHSSVFLSLENVLQLKASRPQKYAPFVDAARRMAESGATFYPHNHGMFDPKTGRHPHRPDRVAGYRKRACMFFDVVYRHGRAIDEWLLYLRALYETLLDDAGIHVPSQLAFRAGGWDYGSTKDDVERFVTALTTAGFAWDSSASTGVFGTRSWRPGIPYGRNVFGLGPDLVEAGACWSVDRITRLFEPRTAYAFLGLAAQPKLWLRRSGIFVTVLHFNVLLESQGSPGARIDALFAKLCALRRILDVDTAIFDELSVTRGAV